MKPIGIVLLVIAIILVAAMIVLYFLGKKAQKKKEEQDEQMKAAAQTVTMLIIDKKRMKMKDAGLPSQVMEQANKLMQRAKLPIVKAKVGPRVMTLIADEQIYDDIPVKKRSQSNRQWSLYHRRTRTPWTAGKTGQKEKRIPCKASGKVQ